MAEYLDKDGLLYYHKKIIQKIPTKTSDITNDSGYVTSSSIPTKVSELTNDAGYTTNTGTYSKPSGGIPKIDLASAVQTSLGKADTALQSYTETDPVFKASAAAGIKSTDITNWNSKTSNTGTITGVSVNGTSVATSGVANITSVPASILKGAIANGVTATTQSQGDNSTKIATTAYVDKAISDLPEPMVFKGSLGTGGTITALPTAAAANEGYTYKVITTGTYANIAAKVGDTFISTGSKWELIPSGDEPNGTVTSVKINATGPIAIDNNAAITTSGTRTISHANSGATAGSYGDSANQTPAYGGTFKVPYVTVNSTGHVTGISEHTVKIPASDNTNTTYTFATGDANGQIKVTPSSGTTQNISVKGLGSLAYSSATIPTKTSQLTNDSGYLTSHQDISGKVNKSGDTMTGALNFKNSTYNKFGDDVEVGDKDVGGTLVLHGLNANTGLQFNPYSGTVAQKISTNGYGEMTVTENLTVAKTIKTSTGNVQLASGVTIHYNSTDKCIEFNFS